MLENEKADLRFPRPVLVPSTDDPLHYYSIYLLGGIEFQKVFGQAYSCQSFPSAADLQGLDSV